MTRRFREAMRLMRKHDPQLKEEGFQLLLPHAADHLDELIAEFQQEDNAHGPRCWLLELIGEARSERALPLLAEQLHGADESLRDWAVAGLENLGSREARQVLYRARANGEIV
ncbi:HEAT repeat domain-containing protein [Actinomadura rudentiformis]|uniref:HEAT repeat domain-containing protein n=1 Tax=Actinomadura rudentiformis TaxID=359158 RepID=A0A6H9YQL9_9ACTN|nr:HEAT repeat domain-containing protein [Actinomadura rudentiformis]KAB2345193.1 HEAT repeat domain-containing protein [Actinomadura rudentiformis]